MDKIAVSVLGHSNKVQLVNNLITKGFRTIHYDIMDGQFVSNRSINISEMRAILNNTKPHTINLHFMVANPLPYIELYKQNADFMTLHYEVLTPARIKTILRRYRHLSLGLAINPNTKVEHIYNLLPFLSHVLVMSVVPGQGGQKFIPLALAKIKKLKAYIKTNNLKCFIQVDGGINDKTGPPCFSAGADIVVSGSYVLAHIDDKTLAQKITGN